MSTPKNQPTPSPQDHDCGICTEAFSDQRPPVPLDNCRHIFCKPCIETWMTSQNLNSDKCPSCRAPIGAQFDDAQGNLGYPAYLSRGRRSVVQPEVQPGQVQNNDLYDVSYENIAPPVRGVTHQVRPSTSGRQLLSRPYQSGAHRQYLSRHHNSSRHYADYDDSFYNYDPVDDDPVRAAFAHFDALRQNAENSRYYAAPAPAPKRRGLRNRLCDVFSSRSSRGADIVYSVGSNGMMRAVVRRRPHGTRDAQDTQFSVVYERR
jgi:hypothetical protein